MVCSIILWASTKFFFKSCPWAKSGPAPGVTRGMVSFQQIFNKTQAFWPSCLCFHMYMKMFICINKAKTGQLHPELPDTGNSEVQGNLR